MNQVYWGILSAVSLGSADFAARFSSRSLGHAHALLGMLLVSALLLAAYVFSTNASALVFDGVPWLIALHGIFFTIAMLALYAALAIGPIKIAAPLVASHPALVVLWAISNGSQLTGLQATGLAATMIGVIVIAYPDKSIGGHPAPEPGSNNHNAVICISALASVFYALMLITGQAAAQAYGVLATLSLGRFVALAVMIVFVVVQPGKITLPFRWWPVLILQGVLDSGGILFLLFGSFGPNKEITVVISATFGAVTVLLAWLFLKEKLSSIQWMAAVLIFAGAACLATVE